MTNPISSHALARAANTILHAGATPAADAATRGPETERSVMRRGAAIVLIAFLGIIFATIAVNYSERSSLPALASSLRRISSHASSALPTSSPGFC